MHKFLHSDIQGKSHHISRLEVQSFEMNVYLVRLQIGDKSGFVYDKHDRPQRFHSSQQVRDTFEHCKVDTAVMIHDSPYDEMIGNPVKAEKPMEMPFSMEQPY